LVQRSFHETTPATNELKQTAVNFADETVLQFFVRRIHYRKFFDVTVRANTVEERSIILSFMCKVNFHDNSILASYTSKKMEDEA